MLYPLFQELKMFYSCPYCGHFTNAKREIRANTGLLAYLIRGWSILLIPLSSPRCRNCGMPVKNAAFPIDKVIIVLMIIGIIFSIVIARSIR
jgi:hypothetical protein